MERIIDINELQWGFDDLGPGVNVGPGKYKTLLRMDPSPGYSHRRDVAEAVFQACEAKFPLPRPAVMYLTRFEGVGRTNGETHRDSDFTQRNEHGEYVTFPWIILFGKRTPIHPAVTRALVAHEYGHAVSHAIAAKRYASNDPCSKLNEDYAEMRGLGKVKYYGPGAWHLAASEVFANDFRISVMGIEPEFWPHDCPHPSESPAVSQWWSEAMKMDLTPGAPPPEKS